MKLKTHNMDFHGTAHNGILMYRCTECPRIIGIQIAPFDILVFMPGNTDVVHMSDAGPIAGSLDPDKVKPTKDDDAWLKALGIQSW